MTNDPGPRTTRIPDPPVVAAVDVWVVNIPLTQPFQSSFETKVGETRTVVRLTLDDGAVGWGETMWGRPVAELVRALGADLVGHSPYRTEQLRVSNHMVPFFHGYLGYAALAALDMACWDAIGRCAGVALVDLLGGRVRDHVPTTGLITRADAGGVSAGELPGAMARCAAELIDQYGFTAVKLKGTADAEGDAAILRAVREALPEMQLRVDPNAAWTVPDSLRVGSRLEPLDLEYLEDPCPGLEGMAQVRARVRTPLCTNMCVVRFEDFAPAVRMNAVDVIHGDVCKWGGIAVTKWLGAHCETFGLGMNLHSGGELGIATAAHLAIVGSTPVLSRAIDSMRYLHADDLTDLESIRDGGYPVPTGHGLGVEVDEDKVSHYAAVSAEQGDFTG